jgi:hypothetical protein|tara:strand:- start:1816 stop:1983 length:168 start_codon:yes stop_codon:yes gene_type:complete
MKKKLKSKLLTYLFTDWVKNEVDVETLTMTRNMIEYRRVDLVGYKPQIGFKTGKV